MTALHSLRERPFADALRAAGAGETLDGEERALAAMAGWLVVGVARCAVPVGEVACLVIQDTHGRRRAVWWDREQRMMVAPLVVEIRDTPGGVVVWSAEGVPAPPPWYPP